MNNSANENSKNAKKANLTYWEYMEKTYSGCVRHFVWGTKKLKRKEEREISGQVNPFMARSPRFGFLSQIRNLIRKRNSY